MVQLADHQYHKLESMFIHVPRKGGARSKGSDLTLEMADQEHKKRSKSEVLTVSSVKTAANPLLNG